MCLFGLASTLGLTYKKPESLCEDLSLTDLSFFIYFFLKRCESMLIYTLGSCLLNLNIYPLLYLKFLQLQGLKHCNLSRHNPLQTNSFEYQLLTLGLLLPPVKTQHEKWTQLVQKKRLLKKKTVVNYNCSKHKNERFKSWSSR